MIDLQLDLDTQESSCLDSRAVESGLWSAIQAIQLSTLTKHSRCSLLLFRKRIDHEIMRSAAMTTRRRIRHRLDPAQTAARESFFRAILDDDVERVRELLEKKEVSVNDRYRYFQRTGLHIAAQRGNIRLIRIICLEFGAEVNDAVDSSGNSPLHYACGSADWNTVQELIRLYPSMSLDTKNYYEETPLLTSCYRAIQDVKQRNGDYPSSWEIVQRLLPLTNNQITDSVSSGNTLLHIVARSENHQFAAKLLKWISTSNPQLVNTPNNIGQTPLHLASQHNTRFCRQLILHDAKIDVEQGCEGRTPLHGPFVTPGSIRLLRKAGADVNVRAGHSEWGATPLQCVVQRASFFRNNNTRKGRNLHMAQVKTLIELGADVHLCDQMGFTLLHSAIHQGISPKLVHVLIHEGHANINATTSEGDTPLHLIVQRPAEQTSFRYGWLSEEAHESNFRATHFAPNLRELLSAGADTTRLNAKQLTPLQVAVTGRRHTATKLLLEHDRSQSIEMRDCQGNTLIHLACDKNPCFRNEESIEELLIRAGASPNASNNSGDTPLHWKVINYFKNRRDRVDSLKIVHFLLAHGGCAGLRNSHQVSPVGQAALLLGEQEDEAEPYQSNLDLELLYILIKDQVGMEGHVNIAIGLKQAHQKQMEDSKSPKPIIKY